MNPQCVRAMNSARTAAGGQPLTPAQVKAIDDGIRKTAKRLAQADPQKWSALSVDQRTMLAAQQAAADIKADAARKVQLAQIQALKTAETEVRLQAKQQRMGWGRSKAWGDDIQQTADYIGGMKKDVSRNLMALINASKSGDGAGLVRKVAIHVFDVENPQMTRDLALEVFAKGEAGTGNKLAQHAAKVWVEQISEPLRIRFNAAGGDVGKLEYGYVPQGWEADLVVKAGYDKFAADVLPEVNRERYLRDDGTKMNDAEVLALLKVSGETIGTGGANKMEPGQFRGTGARANRGSQSREIHFKDGEAYLRVMSKYGSGTMYEAMLSHIGAMTRDIGLVERYGSNPEAQHLLQLDLAKREDNGLKLVFGAGLDAHWRNLTGAAGQPAEWRWDVPFTKAEITGAGFARGMSHVRNVQVIGKLQGSVLASMSDIPTYFSTLNFNKLSYFDGIANLARGLTPVLRGEQVEFANSQGFMADSLIHAVDRFSGEQLGTSLTSHLSQATMKVSLMNMWTDWLRTAYRFTHMQQLGRLVKKDWGELDEWTREILFASRGIGESDWSVIRSAGVKTTKWGDMVTPDLIYRTGHPEAAQVVTRMLGLLQRESEFAVIDPDIATRAFLNRGTQRGTLPGEGARAIAQFKAFPTAMLSRHWRRMLETPMGLEGAPRGYGDSMPAPVNRLALIAGLMLTTSLAGAISFQMKQMAFGRDPVDMTTPKFWLRAMAQGGGFGFLGDVLLRDSSDDRAPNQGLFELLGPTAGSVAEIFELTKGNIDEDLAGKDTHFGAEAVRFARGHLPFLNLWYGKAAIDHMGLHAMQENLSPGYLSRMQSRARKEWNQDFFWEPGSGLPERGPSFAEIAGGD